MPITMRRATSADLTAILEIYAAGALQAQGEDLSDLGPYEKAFAAIDSDPAQQLMVADDDGEVVGTLQLTTIPGLARRAMTRCLVEVVHVRPDRRSQGIGGIMMRWAVEDARQRGCALVQLTSNRAREDAHRFYERLGFEPSHVGFKLPLRPS